MSRVQLIVRSVFTFALFLEGTVSLVAKPVSINVLTEETMVEFTAKDTRNVLTFKGIGKGVVGKFKVLEGGKIEGQASFPLISLDTDLDKRNEHMRKDHLEVSKMPDAKFVPTSLPWADPSQVLKQAIKDAPFEGKLTLHGVEKPIKGTVETSLGKDGRVNYTFAFKVLLTDHEIKIPSFLGVKVDNTVEVIVKTPAKVEVQ